MRRTALHALFLTMLVLCLSWSACADGTPYLTLEKNSFTVCVGAYGWIASRMVQLPSGVYVRGGQWDSSDPSIVTMRQDGKYEAHSAGKAVLTRTVTTSDGNAYQATCTIHVVIPVEKITCDLSELTLCAGDSLGFPDISVFPANAAAQTVQWSTSDKRILQIEENTLRALSAGSCWLTATSTENLPGRTRKSVSLRVTVTQRMTGLSLEHSEESISLRRGMHLQLSAHALPDGIQGLTLIYVSSHPDIASVTSQGYVTALRAGDSVLSVSVQQGDRLFSESLQVHVTIPLDALRFPESTRIAFSGQTFFLSPTWEPADASDVSLRYTSGHPFVASVDEKTGAVACHQVGTASITCTSADGKRTHARVNVEPAIPLRITEGEVQNGQILLTLKSRMRETWITGYTVGLQFRSAENIVLYETAYQVTDQLRPAKFSTASWLLDSKIPKDAVSIAVCILQVSYDGGSYSLPSEAPLTFSMTAGS